MRFSELLLAVADVQGFAACVSLPRTRIDFTPDIVEAIERQPKNLQTTYTCRCSRVRPECCVRCQRTYSREEYLEKIA